MATKINTTYFGTADTWQFNSTYGSDCKYSSYTLSQLVTSGKWDIDNNIDIDPTIVPWGMPQCSLSSNAYTIFTNDSGYLKTILHTSDVKNVPLMIEGAINGTGYSTELGNNITDARNGQKRRILGNTTNSSGVTYTTPDGTTVTYSGKPVTYLNYQRTKIVLGNCVLLNLTDGTRRTIAVKDLLTQTETPTKNEVLVYVESLFCTNNNTGSDVYLTPTTAIANNAPPHLANRYLNSSSVRIMNPSRKISKSLGNGTTIASQTATSNIRTYSSIVSGAQTVDFPCHAYTTPYCNLSDKNQYFGDVSYHWEMMCYFTASNVPVYIKNGDTLPSSSTNLFFVDYLVLDSTTYENRYHAMYYALIHEFSFLGFPVVDNSANISLDIGDDNVFVPVFDTEHMITTGEFISGADSLDLDNSSWGDIFDDGVPVWDPDYIPPDPQPITDNSDWGDLDNSGANRHYNVPLYIQACNELTLQTIIANVNNYYAVSGVPTADDVYRLQTDFQGSNPADYIVACYAPFVDIDVMTQQHFRIGPITFDGNGNTEINILPIDDTDSDNYTFDCGSIYVPYYMQGETDTEHNDFRSYEPYTTAELYLPLCGTIDIDMKFFAGSYMNVIYYYDLFTMSCTAAVYRISNGKTKLYTVINGIIGVELPLTTSAMGTYQNNLHAIQTALKQNEIRIATSAATMAIGATATVATGGTAALLGAGGIVSGTSSLFSTYLQREQLQYELTHTQPNIGTTSAAHAQNQFCVGGLYPILFIKRALMLDTYDPDIYSKTIGNSCCINSLVGDMSGLIICSDIKCDGITNAAGDSPTADEINAIKQAFNNGVIV